MFVYSITRNWKRDNFTTSTSSSWVLKCTSDTFKIKYLKVSLTCIAKPVY